MHWKKMAYITQSGEKNQKNKKEEGKSDKMRD